MLWTFLSWNQTNSLWNRYHREPNCPPQRWTRFSFIYYNILFVLSWPMSLIVHRCHALGLQTPMSLCKELRMRKNSTLRSPKYLETTVLGKLNLRNYFILIKEIRKISLLHFHLFSVSNHSKRDEGKEWYLWIVSWDEDLDQTNGVSCLGQLQFHFSVFDVSKYIKEYQEYKTTLSKLDNTVS